MSLTLSLLTVAMRVFVKPRLARARSAETMRAGLRRARVLAPAPSDRLEVWRETLAPNADADAAADAAADADPTGGSEPGGSEPGGPRLEAEWTRPAAARPDRVTLYFHGGAYLAGDGVSHRRVAAALARAARSLSCAPEYRLAPEAPFPAAFEDAVRAYDALRARGFAPGAIALAGDSAGAGLAAALAAEIGRRGEPPPSAMTLFSPYADLSLSGWSLKAAARREALLPVERIADAADAYLAGADPKDPRASPAWARFAAPPPTLLQAGADEALLDDARRLADALRAGGGDVTLEIWRGAPHAWQFFAGLIPEATAAVSAAGRFIARRMAERAAPPDAAARVHAAVGLAR